MPRWKGEDPKETAGKQPGPACFPNLWTLAGIWKLAWKATWKHLRLCGHLHYQDKESKVNFELIFSLAFEISRLGVDF